ncbi:hypothetical protein UPYG_G00011050 [Umbra pygmaea]|uniref:Ligand-dependent nuclear receptor-interacting factor 1 n=1 Tax=Umbra pygmaea TaxID=75934 RepID=A0ABD0XIK6_UMBPY
MSMNQGSYIGKTMASQGGCLSGTGVFYQAMPAVGTDGRNVMKLIPVQKVNGQFVRSPTSTIKCTEPQGDLNLNLPSVAMREMPPLKPTAKGQFVSKWPSQILSTSTNAGTYPSVRIHTPIATSKSAQCAGSLTSPELTYRQTFGLKKQLPVTVKSPALPNGQYLQIPPNAQVKTLPASALPPAIKRQIFTSPMSYVSNSPMVLYVSPVQTMKQGVNPQKQGVNPQCPKSSTAALSLSRIQVSSGQTISTCSSTCSTQCSTTSKDSKRPVTPIKWVIEETDGSPAPCLVPVKSTSMTSEILKTLAKMEKANETSDNTANFSPTQESKKNNDQEKDNALVMYNGKVYFVAKKTPELCNRPSEPLEANRNMSYSSTHATESLGFNKRIISPPTKSSSSSFKTQLPNKTRPDPKHIVIPDEIIDLCDDEPQDDLACQIVLTKDVTEQPSRQSDVDEDEDSNVIFVSYLPPKTVSKVAGKNVEAHVLADLETEQVLHRQDNLNALLVGTQNKVSVMSVEKCHNVSIAKDMAGYQSSATGQELIYHPQKITATGLEKPQVDATSQLSEILEPSSSLQEMVNIQSDATDHGLGKNQHSASTQEIKNIPRSTILQIQKDTHIEKSSTSDPMLEHQTSMLDKDSLKTCDRLQRQMFGITFDVKICLERVDAKPKAIPKVFPQIGTTNKSTIEAIRKLLQGSKMVIKKREHKETMVSATKNDDRCAKHAKIQKVDIDFENASEVQHLFRPIPQQDVHHLTSPSPQAAMLSDTEQMFGCEEPTVSDLICTTDFLSRPLPDHHPVHVSKKSSNSMVQSVYPQANIKDMDSAVEPCCSTASRMTINSRRRGKARRCTVCPCGVTETLVPEKAIGSLSNLQVDSGSSKSAKKISRKSTKLQTKDTVQYASTVTEHGSSTAGQIPTSYLCSTSPMDCEEIKRNERIKRLKELLKEKEAGLALIRKNMG